MDATLGCSELAAKVKAGAISWLGVLEMQSEESELSSKTLALANYEGLL